MKIETRIAGTALLAGAMLLVPSDLIAGRFGGGGGGGRGGGGGFQGGYRGGGGGFQSGGFQNNNFSRGGYQGGAPMARPQQGQNFNRGVAQNSTVHGPYGGNQSKTYDFSGNAARGATGETIGRNGSWTGANGGTAQGGSKYGTYTGPNGAVAIGGGRGGTVTGPNGNTAGGARGGAVVIGPNGNVHATTGRVGGVQTPNGTVAGGSHVGITTGPGGAAVNAGRSGFATGPGGTVAGSSHSVVASGPGGTVAAGSRHGVAVGPYGAVAAGGRGAVGFGPGGAAYAGTRFVATSNLANQGLYVRQSFGHYNCFHAGWYTRYPGAWYATDWASNAAWNYATWANLASTMSYAETTAPIYYDYGDTVTYNDGNVYYGDQVYSTEAAYADQATQIADAGVQAQPPADDKWQPLGVFAMVKGDETTSNDIFQLAINKKGIVRGNYYNAKTDATTPISGALDNKTQRIAWIIGDKKDTVFETGLYNLTLDQSTMLVHFGKEKTEQYKLFKVPPPPDEEKK